MGGSICIFTSVSPVSHHTIAEPLKQKQRYQNSHG